MLARQTTRLSTSGATQYAPARAAGINALRNARRYASATAEPWFKAGLSFSCTKCGNCCSGTKGQVRFLDSEVDAMATKMDTSVPEFLQKYARRQGRGAKSFFQLKQKRTSDGFDCIFLDRKLVKGKAVCSLYHARPMQCRTWPYWPENLETRQTWERLKSAKEGCPGILKGPSIPAEEVQHHRDAMEHWRKAVDVPTTLK
ncbi:hypothetical protein H310_04207 [Aphanomyces invadans]|uniref:Zinc/iron-chelating domain-containing protein n=1 Tax=Aphanomyces invadans TaxID=157072 RepID=A0A024UH82_9STRA|nr:hypothetical protein H310_04207 [Aphanomyces invadans]ETW05237.1 hypothetical protein H310_04207 [Aphanomyces invadans]|eukprot:XP_008866675.1 hypothetical protein H310_04207 [Aphanomyces invadans]